MAGVAARPVLIIGVGGVHRREQLVRPHPNRRVLVPGDIQDQEPVRLSIIRAQGRDVPAPLLAERFA